MNEFYAVVDAETGAFRWHGSGPEGEAQQQLLPEGLIAIVVPEDAVRSDPVNLAMIQEYFAAYQSAAHNE